MMPMVVIFPRTTRSPFQIYLVALVILGGFGIITGVNRNMIINAMGEPYATYWGLFLTVGGLLILMGIYWPRDKFTGMLVERTGLVALGGASAIWSVLVIWKTQTNGLFSALLTLGLFLACLRQWRWIDKNVHKVIKAVDDGRSSSQDSASSTD